MFINRPDCQKLADNVEIYVFKNCVPKDLIDKYTEIFEAKPAEVYAEDTNAIPWYNDHMSPLVPELIDFWEHLSELIYPEYVINPQLQVIASRPGQTGMFIHCDSPGKGRADMLTQIDAYGTCSLIDYGVVAYFGTFEGGEIFYPAFDSNGNPRPDSERENPIGALMYKPEPGDVVIHSAYAPYYHGTMPVTSGVRYAYSCFATDVTIAPKTFYHYKSPEYKEKVKDRSDQSLKNWSELVQN
jgi:hypothetical protein